VKLAVDPPPPLRRRSKRRLHGICPARNLLPGPTCARGGPFSCDCCPGSPSLGTPSSVCSCHALWPPMTIHRSLVHVRPLLKDSSLDFRQLRLLLQGDLEQPGRPTRRPR
jgi:hypothetical protein